MRLTVEKARDLFSALARFNTEGKRVGILYRNENLIGADRALLKKVQGALEPKLVITDEVITDLNTRLVSKAITREVYDTHLKELYVQVDNYDIEHFEEDFINRLVCSEEEYNCLMLLVRKEGEQTKPAVEAKKGLKVVKETKKK